MSAHAPNEAHGPAAHAPTEGGHGHAEAGHETSKKSIFDRISSWVKGAVKWVLAAPAAAFGIVTGAIEGGFNNADSFISSGAQDFDYAFS